MTGLPVEGELVRIDRQPHRVLAVIGDRVLLVHVVSQMVYLVRDQDGGIALPDAGHWNELVGHGRASTAAGTSRQATLADNGDDPDTAKLRLQIDMLEAAGVPNGDKAMAIWLAAHWTPSLKARFGEHSNVHTLRRWRVLRGRAADVDGGDERS